MPSQFHLGHNKNRWSEINTLWVMITGISLSSHGPTEGDPNGNIGSPKL